jgi:Ca2+-binding RTX toxin-like protein
LVTVALMLAAAMALSGVAQTKPTSVSPDAKCAKLASQTLGKGFNPADYTFHGGTEGNDDFTTVQQDPVPEVFCGFGGDDEMTDLVADDIFLSGAGNDLILTENHGGTFYGGDGDDLVGDVNRERGTFYGGEGNDLVNLNRTGATFIGGEGNDTVLSNAGTFEQD